jgi:hypothetical protein
MKPTVRVTRRWALGLMLAGTMFASGYWLAAPEQLNGTLTAGLGDTIAEVAARSSYPLNTAILHDEDLSAADRPVLFRYVGPGGFDLPPTLTVSIDSMATVVTGIQMAPQLEYLGLDGVRALAQEIEPRLLAAGWTLDPTARGLTRWDDLAPALADPSELEGRSWYLGVYRHGDAELAIRLRRMHRTWRGLQGGALLLNLVWDDDRLRQRAEAVVDRLRREDGATVILSRPVDAAAYSARVRALLPVQAVEGTVGP